MTDLAIAANKQLVGEYNSVIKLNREDYLPHISLAMGCIENDDIPRACALLGPLTAITPKRLKLTGIQKSNSFSGEIVSVLKVERTGRLQKLHEKICGLVKPIFTYDVTEDMIAGERAGQATLQWIAGYPDKSSYSNFSPHITIGYGELTDCALPADFAVSRLALCRLGNHCTCREILWSAEV
jgi:2'-5' RNA ligase